MARKKTPPTPPDPEPRPATDDDRPPVPSPKPRTGRAGATPPGEPARDAAPARKPPKKGARRVKASPARLGHDAASDLVDRARQSPDPKQRTSLAREAIKLNPDCAEAFLILAEEARSRKAALKQFGLAVDAAERALGPDIFREGAGEFWLMVETRPYMRARAALADASWASGSRDDAVKHLEDLLRLNPDDNQGLRYILAGWLLHLGRVDTLSALLDRYDEESTVWTFTRALVAYRTSGDTPATRKLLQAARRGNKHVVDFLIGREPLPNEPPPFYSPGDADDAALYVASNLGSWKATPGALSWVRALAKPSKRKAKARAAIGPTATSRRQLAEFPSEDDTWQADYRQFARRIEVGGERIRPWMVLVSSRSRDQVLAHSLTEQEPTSEFLWDALARAIAEPAAGEPHRPTSLQIRASAEAWKVLAGPIAALGIECDSLETLDQAEFLFDNLAQHLEGARQPGILDMPGVRPEQVERFYRVAAEFYRRAPWRDLGFEAVARVECDRYQSGPWYAVVMGQSGLTLGLALYEDLNLLRRMYRGQLSDEEGARRTVALTVTFDDSSSVPEADLDAIEAHGWPVATPEAYPSFFRKERGLSMRPPLAWEIDLMVGCLAALPDFIARRRVDDSTRELIPVPDASGGRIEIGLAWLPEPR